MGVIHFLDVLEHKLDMIFLACVPINPFSQVYVPIRICEEQKLNFIKTFVYHILLICSKTKLNSEIEFINKFGGL